MADDKEQLATSLSGRIDDIETCFKKLISCGWMYDDARSLCHLAEGGAAVAGVLGMQMLANACMDFCTSLRACISAGRDPSEAELNALGELLYKLKYESGCINIEHILSQPNTVTTQGRTTDTSLIFLALADSAEAAMYVQVLEENGYHASLFDNTEALHEACHSAGAEFPAAIVIDDLPPAEDFPNDALADVFAMARRHRIAVICFGDSSHFQAYLAGLRAGADRYLVKPVKSATLLSQLQELVMPTPARPVRVLLVAEDNLFLHAHAMVMRAAGITVNTLSRPMEILDAVDEWQPDIVLADADMQEATGVELAAVIRSCHGLTGPAILCLTKPGCPDGNGQGATADRVTEISKPVQANELIALVESLAGFMRRDADLTERLQDQKVKREREHEAIHEHALVSVTDHYGNIIYVNRQFCEVTGYSEAELLGENHRIIKSDKHSPEFYRDLWRTIAQGKIWKGIICNRRKDGSHDWGVSTIVPYLDKHSGKPYRYASIRTDITALKLGLNYANIGIWNWDVQTGQLYWTERIAVLFGYSPGELETTFDNLINAIYPEDRQVVIDAINACIEDDKPFEIEHRVVWPDGTVHWLLVRGDVTRDAEGRALQMTGVVLGIDAHKRAEIELVRAREEAERANRAKSEFLSQMSHELRTPMNSVLGFAQLMQYSGDLPAEHAASVHEIIQAGQHLLELINQVLDLSKVESGNVNLALEPVDLCSVIEECVSMVTSMAEQRGIIIEHPVCSGAFVRADRTRLKQAMLNLLSNAVKYNRDAGEVSVEVHESENRERVRILVSDTGEGLSQEQIKRLFEPFERLDAEDSKVEGSGIGLTISRRLVEMMNGTVEVQSQPGMGSTFWIELPIACLSREKTSDALDADPRLNTTMSDNVPPSQTVLYLDDKPANIRLVTGVLSQVCHLSLLTARSMEQAIELAMTRHPDVILLDIDMLGQDSYQFLDWLRGDSRIPATPVIAISASATPADIERSKAAGFAEYLTKPLQVDTLLSTLNRYLNQLP